MHSFTQDYIRCTRCASKLSLDTLSQNNEIEEGFLYCDKCIITFPIIQKIPIMWDGFVDFISNRASLGGHLYKTAASQKMKLFLKDSLQKIIKPNEDRTNLELRWTLIYQKSKRSRFYSIIKKQLAGFSSKVCLEHGCSIGMISESLSQHNEMVFGIDRSFSAIAVAKKTARKNLDYLVADSLSNPFGKKKFDLVVALNVLELIEPKDFLKNVTKQTRDVFVLSDPYDFDRGKYSVRHPLDEKSLRSELENLGFVLSKHTIEPSKIAWNLKLNERTQLNYKLDVIICTKKHH